MWWGFHTAPSHLSQGRNGFATICLIVLGLSLIGGILWFWKKLIKEFTYDGRTLTFNTLATPEMQVRDLSSIKEVAEWTGRGGPLGSYIKFHDGAKLYVSNAVPNAAALADRIRCDLGSPAAGPKSRRPARLAITLLIAICAGCLAAVTTSRFLQRLPPEISPTEFLSEVDQQHVNKVVIRDRALINGTSSSRGAFRVRMPVDELILNKLHSRGVVVEFETSSDLTP